MSTYTELLMAEDQIDTEEAIAALIDRRSGPSFMLSEEDCANLGREILMLVLKKFRPDLVE